MSGLDSLMRIKRALLALHYQLGNYEPASEQRIADYGVMVPRIAPATDSAEDVAYARIYRDQLRRSQDVPVAAGRQTC